ALDPDCGDSLSQIAGRVRPGATVLDLGAGPGVLGHHLAQSRQCTVDGVEANPRATEFAHSAYRHWIEANLETLSLDRLQAGAPYDYIVCADVLEHLRQPERLLNALHPLLTSEGALLISVPNVAYAGLVA